MSPYRWSLPPLKPREPSFVTRVLCFVLGHRWKILRVHNPFMAHLHPTAGVDARCSRCGCVSLWVTGRP